MKTERKLLGLHDGGGKNPFGDYFWGYVGITYFSTEFTFSLNKKNKTEIIMMGHQNRIE